MIICSGVENNNGFLGIMRFFLYLCNIGRESSAPDFVDFSASGFIGGDN